MRTGIMITDGGPHGADKWAYTSASHILDMFDIDPKSPRMVELEMAKDALRAKICAVLIPHHTSAQDGERAKIAEVGHDRILADLTDIHADHVDVDKAADEIIAAFKDSPLAEFVGPDQIAAIKERVAVDARTIVHIEHGWHAARNPDTAQAAEFRQRFHG
jgi:hypothetical protein